MSGQIHPRTVGWESFPLYSTVASSQLGSSSGRRIKLTSYWRTVHNLELGNRLALVVLVRWRACCFAPDDRQLHVLDLDAHEEEVNLANDDVLEVVSAVRQYHGA